jgi:hypothetical protein
MPPAAKSRSASRTTVKNSHSLSFRLRTADKLPSYALGSSAASPPAATYVAS